MWNLFNQRREMNTEVYDKLLPGDLYGGAPGTRRQPEEYVRYLMLANVSLLTFFGIVLSRVAAGARGHEEIYGAVWLAAMGIAIALVAWVLFRLSRAGEARALSLHPGAGDASSLPANVKAIMKQAAVKKLLGFRIMIVSAISGCIGLYVGLKGLYFIL